MQVMLVDNFEMKQQSGDSVQALSKKYQLDTLVKSSRLVCLGPETGSNIAVSLVVSSRHIFSFLPF